MSTPESIKPEEDMSGYFTIETLRESYPSNLGVVDAFKIFANQRKVRPSKIFTVKRRINAVEGNVSRKIAGYRPSRIIKEIEDYLSAGNYRVGVERRLYLGYILKSVREFKECQLEKK